jgi:hypothetical protein
MDLSLSTALLSVSNIQNIFDYSIPIFCFPCQPPLNFSFYYIQAVIIIDRHFIRQILL